MEREEVKQMLLSLYTRLQTLRNEDGASAVEYGLLVALIALIIIVAVSALGLSLNDIFNEVAEGIEQ